MLYHVVTFPRTSHYETRTSTINYTTDILRLRTSTLKMARFATIILTAKQSPQHLKCQTLLENTFLFYFTFLWKKIGFVLVKAIISNNFSGRFTSLARQILLFYRLDLRVFDTYEAHISGRFRNKSIMPKTTKSKRTSPRLNASSSASIPKGSQPKPSGPQSRQTKTQMKKQMKAIRERKSLVLRNQTELKAFCNSTEKSYLQCLLTLLQPRSPHVRIS